jgi:hypothetical protein
MISGDFVHGMRADSLFDMVVDVWFCFDQKACSGGVLFGCSKEMGVAIISNVFDRYQRPRFSSHLVGASQPDDRPRVRCKLTAARLQINIIVLEGYGIQHFPWFT